MQYAKIVVSHSSSWIIKCETFLSKEIPERVTKKNKQNIGRYVKQNEWGNFVFFFKPGHTDKNELFFRDSFMNLSSHCVLANTISTIWLSD